MQSDYLRTGETWEKLPWHGRGGNILCRSGLQPRASSEWIAAVATLDRMASENDAYVAASVILADIDAAVALAREIEAAGIRLLEFNVGTPYGEFPVLRVATDLTRTSGFTTLATSRTYTWVAECFGPVATATSQDFESSAEFTNIREVRRLAP